MRRELVKGIKEEYGLSREEISKVVMLCDVMPSDPDGCWTMLQDEGIDILFDDVANLCSTFN